MIKGVTLDFGDTLANGALDKVTFRKRLLNYLKSLGYSRDQNQIRKVRSQMLQKLERARSFNREIRLENLYPFLLLKLGLHPEREVLNHIHKLYVNSFNSEFIPGVEEVFEYLKGKYKLAVISNSISNVPRFFLERAGFEKYLEAIVISRDLGIRKPDPEIFNYTLAKLGIESEEAIHVGDSLEQDVKGARDVGMKTVWIKKDNEEMITKPDFIIHSIGELISIL